jgi:hypothetical protein
MTIQNKDLEKAFEKVLSNTLSSEDSLKLQVQNTVKYTLGTLIQRTNYKSYRLHKNNVCVEIPDFFHYNKLDLGKIVSEDFNYKHKIGMSFTVEKSPKPIDKFINYRKDEVDSKWYRLNNFTININSTYDFSQLIFKNIKLNYLKGLFINRIDNNQYLVITIVAPKKYFFDYNSFIYRVFTSINLNN